jgi:small subunit ribosomal protein S16
MLTIRLARVGKKNKPFYRLVISQKRKDLYGDSLEILGSYNPYSKELKANGEKIRYWLSRGAQMSPTVNNLLIEKKIIEGRKVKASKAKKSKKSQAETGPESKKGVPQTETPKTNSPKAEVNQAQAQKTETTKTEAAKVEKTPA